MRHRLTLIAALACVAALTYLAAAPSQQVVQPAAPGFVIEQAPGAPGNPQVPFCLSTNSGGAAAATVTVPPLGGKQIYVTGFEITGDGATGQSIIAITLAWGGTTAATYQYNVVAGATTANPTLAIEFTLPVTTGSPGANCVLTVPSFGAGNTASAAVIHGYYQ